ncbi:MAG: site-2 protease family protein [Methanomassiliicoccaceae archaeon]|nr:site-2 protease family protein [Methanomassiliicoccaceae archaeon]
MRSINPTIGVRYSRIELRDIALSVMVLSVAFTIMFVRNGSNMEILELLAVSAVVVCASFVVHELGHKFTAQRYGAWAEYRMFPMGLMMALLLSFAGVIFAAPGAVYISGRMNEEMNGKISAAGPGVNIVLGTAAFAVSMMTAGIVSNVFMIMASINAFFAVFNMIPIRPFDGSKIYRWNVPVYLIMLTVSAALLFAVWFL